MMETKTHVRTHPSTVIFFLKYRILTLKLKVYTIYIQKKKQKKKEQTKKREKEQLTFLTL